MEKKINIAELLKDCPKGMELDCTMWENVVFDHIDMTSNYPIFITKMNGEKEYLTEEGCFNFDLGAKCVIFPKGKTTWEGFVSPCKFKDGDVVVGNNSCCSYIAIYKEFRDKSSFYCHVVYNSFGKFKTNDYSDNLNLCFANEKEKEKLFDVIKANGYKWNSKTKTLEKLIEPKFKVGDKIRHKDNKTVIHTINYIYYDSYGLYDNHLLFFKEQDRYELVPDKFDINTLKPFDKVLVRDSGKKYWNINFFGFYNEITEQFHCMGNTGIGWNECIPYDVNKELLGTTNDCDEYYKTWE